jgi:hypothetical protein
MPRAEIVIQPQVRLGATVFVSRDGGVSVKQCTGDDDNAYLAFEPDEALLVAAALIEVAEAAKARRTEEEHGDR